MSVPSSRLRCSVAPAMCAVCAVDVHTSPDVIVACSECGECAHAMCGWGSVDAASDATRRCPVCAFVASNRAAAAGGGTDEASMHGAAVAVDPPPPPCCCLCPIPGGWLMRVTGASPAELSGERARGEGECDWAHVACVGWMAETGA